MVAPVWLVRVAPVPLVEKVLVPLAPPRFWIDALFSLVSVPLLVKVAWFWLTIALLSFVSAPLLFRFVPEPSLVRVAKFWLLSVPVLLSVPPVWLVSAPLVPPTPPPSLVSVASFCNVAPFWLNIWPRLLIVAESLFHSWVPVPSLVTVPPTSLVSREPAPVLTNWPPV